MIFFLFFAIYPQKTIRININYTNKFVLKQINLNKE